MGPGSGNPPGPPRVWRTSCDEMRSMIVPVGSSNVATIARQTAKEDQYDQHRHTDMPFRASDLLIWRPWQDSNLQPTD